MCWCCWWLCVRSIPFALFICTYGALLSQVMENTRCVDCTCTWYHLTHPLGSITFPLAFFIIICIKLSFKFLKDLIVVVVFIVFVSIPIAFDLAIVVFAVAFAIVVVCSCRLADGRKLRRRSLFFIWAVFFEKGQQGHLFCHGQERKRYQFTNKC